MPGSGAIAAPSAQGVESSGGQHIFLLPGEQTQVSVEVHIAELWLNASGENNFVDVDATYRLRNAERTGANPLVRVATATGAVGVGNLAHISNLSVTSGDTGVGLQETENGNYTFRIPVAADGRTTVRLRYRVNLGNEPLATVRYALEPLNRWPGEISIRVEAKAPDSIATDSWTRVEPNGWSYGLATDPGRIDVKWLYNRRAPDAPVIFQYVNPTLWQQLRTIELTPTGARTFDQYRRLGELYQILYDASGQVPAVRERFFSQTVAANAAALQVANQSEAQATAAQRGEIHYRLARLYRAHAPFVDEAQANEYAQLMVVEVAAALENLPPLDSRLAEMGRWRADGLTLLLNQAREQAEWDLALAIVDELETLPPGSISANFIEQERANLLIQKALQLLEEGNREAALAVAGPQLSGAQLEPPAQMQNLFARWTLTVTATPDTVHIVALGHTNPDRHLDAYTAAQNMIQVFTSGTTRRTSEVRAGLTDLAQPTTNGSMTQPALELDIYLAAGTNTAFLANLAPVGIDWILLRTLLEQISVQVAENNTLLRRTVTLSQPLDLRPAATQWASMAGTLERQAQEFEAAAAAATQSQDALANRARAVHYRAMAENWRDLAAQSRLHFEFRVGESTQASIESALESGDTQPVLNRMGGGPVTRSWYVAASGPSQIFTLQAQLLNMARLITLAIVALSVILALSGLLWWLL